MKKPMGTYFKVEWVPIPMLPCPFCGLKATFRHNWTSSRKDAQNRIEVGCENEKCQVKPIAMILWQGNPKDQVTVSDNTIKAKNNWNKRTKRKM